MHDPGCVGGSRLAVIVRVHDAVVGSRRLAVIDRVRKAIVGGCCLALIALASLSFASSLVRGDTYARWLLLLWRRTSQNSVKRKFGIASIAPIQISMTT